MQTFPFITVRAHSTKPVTVLVAIGECNSATKKEVQKIVGVANSQQEGLAIAKHLCDHVGYTLIRV